VGLETGKQWALSCVVCCLILSFNQAALAGTNVKEDSVSKRSVKEVVSQPMKLYTLPDTWNETADQIHILDRELKWTRHLKTLLKLPSWIDLGLENRTRFESLSFPF